MTGYARPVRARGYAPDSPLLITKPNHMANYHLVYGISKRTPVQPKALKEILDAQTAVNRVCTWTHDHLSLEAPRGTGRAGFTLSIPRFGFVAGPAPVPSDGFGASAPGSSADAYAQGSTRVRDNLWNAHLVAAFLRFVSRKHPGLLFELRDEGGFVVPGAVWIKGGSVEANREFLNRERARALEVTGDPQAAAPFVWAELQALNGKHFVDEPVSEYMGIPEIQGLGASWDDLQEMSLADAAEAIVERAVETAVPQAA